MKALLFINGFGLFALAMLIGWVWFLSCWKRSRCGRCPSTFRSTFRMAHMEGITQGLMLMGLAAAGRFIVLSPTQFKWLFWSALASAWLFTIGALLNVVFGNRGLGFGGGPFRPGPANDVIFLSGYPAILGVHIMIGLVMWGLWKYLRDNRAA